MCMYHSVPVHSPDGASRMHRVACADRPGIACMHGRLALIGSAAGSAVHPCMPGSCCCARIGRHHRTLLVGWHAWTGPRWTCCASVSGGCRAGHVGSQQTQKHTRPPVSTACLPACLPAARAYAASPTRRTATMDKVKEKMEKLRRDAEEALARADEAERRAKEVRTHAAAPAAVISGTARPLTAASMSNQRRAARSTAGGAQRQAGERHPQPQQQEHHARQRPRHRRGPPRRRREQLQAGAAPRSRRSAAGARGSSED